MKSKEQIKRFKFVLWIAWIIYLLIACRLIIWKSWGGFSYISQCYASFDSWKQEVLWNLNFIPFRFLFDIHGYTLVTWCKNVMGNIILFVPAGFFLLCLFPNVRTWSFKKYTVFMAVTIIVIELFQLLLMCGHCDIDDFMLNLVGACLGFQVTKQASKMRGILNQKSRFNRSFGESGGGTKGKD